MRRGGGEVNGRAGDGMWSRGARGWGPLLAVVLALPLLGGCYGYAPIELSTIDRLERATPLEIRLAEPMAVELEEVTVRRTVRIRGEFVGWDRGGTDAAAPRKLVLSAMWVVSEAGMGRDGGGVTVRLPESAIASVRERKLSVAKTALVVIPIGVAAVTLPLVLEDDPGSGGNGGGPPPIE